MYSWVRSFGCRGGWRLRWFDLKNSKTQRNFENTFQSCSIDLRLYPNLFALFQRLFLLKICVGYAIIVVLLQAAWQRTNTRPMCADEFLFWIANKRLKMFKKLKQPTTSRKQWIRLIIALFIQIFFYNLQDFFFRHSHHNLDSNNYNWYYRGARVRVVFSNTQSLLRREMDWPFAKTI